MQLIKLLTESSSLPIESLKKAISKDSRISSILKKEPPQLEDISDKEAFLSTVKYYVLNNENVRNFVASRNNVKDIDTKSLSEFRKLRGKDLTQNQLDWLSEFVKNIFKEHGAVQRSTISAEARKQLSDWVNGNNRYHSLTPYVQRELESIPSIRPDKRVLLYRGLLFKEHDLSQRETYNGTLEVGNGIKFARAIKKGTREVVLEWERPSSWTYDKQIAESFAKYGPASSNYAATFQWLERSMKGRHIDGVVGYIISTYANPEDILVDMKMLNRDLGSQHGDEGEVILKPGKYLARISKKYTVESGEVDPVADNEEPSRAVELIQKAKEFGQAFEAPSVSGVEKLPYSTRYDAAVLLNQKDVFKKLILNSTTTEIMHAFEKALKFYNAEIKQLQDELKADKVAAHEDISAKAQTLRDAISIFTTTVRHSKFKDGKNNSSGKRGDLDVDEIRSIISPSDIREFEKDLLTRGIISSRESENFLTQIAKYVGVKVPSNSRIRQMGAPKQKPIIQDVVDKFYDFIGVTKPEDTQEAIKGLINYLRKAHRNFVLLDELQTFKNKLGELA